MGEMNFKKDKKETMDSCLMTWINRGTQSHSQQLHVSDVFLDLKLSILHSEYISKAKYQYFW